jgi:SNF2 family DNA or RNA helicase
LVDINVDKGTIYLKSEYDRNIVSFMRSRPKRYWNTNTRTWELPESDLQLLLERLEGYEYNIKYSQEELTDNTNIQKGNKQNIPSLVPEWYEFKTKPYSHQIDGVNYGLSHDTFLLADEPGCGKTKQMLDLSCILKKQENMKHVLIIACVNGLKYNWFNEIKTHTNERGYILGTRYNKKGESHIGSNEERLADIESIGKGTDIDNCFYLITNIETLRYSKTVEVPLKTKKNGIQRFKKQTIFPIVKALQEQIKQGNISMVIADELHRCKNSASIQGRALLSLNSKHKAALTGTPLMNNPIDVYTIISWLGYENHSLFAFKKHYCIMGGFGQHQIVGYKNLPELQGILDKCMLRRLKSEVLDLPEKIYINDYVDMTKEQQKLYNDVREQILTNIDKVKLSPNPLVQLTRLRQVTGNPGILSSSAKTNPKFDRMLEIVEDIVENGEKCIVFSNWTDVLIPAYELLNNKGYCPALYTGQNKNDREQEKDRFMTSPGCKVLCGTIGAMGVGLTLTAANTVIFLDEPWNRATKDQCEDRIHRIGTKSSPNVITIMCKDTIDERINNIVYKKGKMSDIIVDKEEDILKNPKLLNYLLSI